MEKPDLEPYRALAEAGPLAVAEEAYRRGLRGIGVISAVKEICSVPLTTAIDAMAEAHLNLPPEMTASDGPT